MCTVIVFTLVWNSNNSGFQFGPSNVITESRATRLTLSVERNALKKQAKECITFCAACDLECSSDELKTHRPPTPLCVCCGKWKRERV